MHLGKYEILGPIGSGGFGRVWLARSPDEGDAPSSLVAIKRIKASRLRNGTSLAKVNRYLEAFRYEAKIGSYLNHPNLVRVIELFRSGRGYALVMEFVNGLGLDEMLEQRRRKKLAMPPNIALRIAIQAGRGLDYAHKALSPDGVPLSVVHRDIKPSNIMIGRDGRVRVMDFGVARSILPRTETTTGTVKGTLRYLSPEQAQGRRDIGPPTDQFALALVFGEMLVGRPMYDAKEDHRILMCALTGAVGTKISEADTACPGVGEVLIRALAAKPEERYACVGDFADALEGISPPLETLIDLSEWVHRGLEERARLNSEDWVPDFELDSSPDLAPSSVEKSPQEEARKGEVWQMKEMGRAQALLSSAAEEDEGWELHPEQDISEPNLIQIGPEEDDWAVGPSASDSVDMQILGQPEALSKTIEYARKGAGNDRRRHVEQLRNLKTAEFQRKEKPVASPTEYAMGAGARERVSVKLVEPDLKVDWLESEEKPSEETGEVEGESGELESRQSHTDGSAVVNP